MLVTSFHNQSNLFWFWVFVGIESDVQDQNGCNVMFNFTWTVQRGYLIFLSQGCVSMPAFATMWYLLFQLITCRLISTVDSTHPHITTNQVFWRNIITSRLLSEWVVLILVKPEICSHRETWTRLCWYELSAWVLIEKLWIKRRLKSVVGWPRWQHSHTSSFTADVYH